MTITGKTCLQTLDSNFNHDYCYPSDWFISPAAGRNLTEHYVEDKANAVRESVYFDAKNHSVEHHRWILNHKASAFYLD